MVEQPVCIVTHSMTTCTAAPDGANQEGSTQQDQALLPSLGQLYPSPVLFQHLAPGHHVLMCCRVCSQSPPRATLPAAHPSGAARALPVTEPDSPNPALQHWRTGPNNSAWQLPAVLVGSQHPGGSRLCVLWRWGAVSTAAAAG